MCFRGRGRWDWQPSGNGTPYYESVDILDGQVPYRDFSVEYPPLALPIFLLPAHLFASDGLLSYLHAFRFVMAAFGLGCLFGVDWILRRLGASTLRRAGGLALFAVTPLALGPFFLNRYDLGPALLVVCAIMTLMARRAAWSGGLVGAAFAAKTYPIVIAPIAALRLRTNGRRALRSAVVAGTAVVLASYAYFIVVAAAGSLSVSGFKSPGTSKRRASAHLSFSLSTG